MAERRMFAKKITESDAFLDMPSSTQMLYFHLSMNADDDGFVNNPKKIQRMCGASDDDFKLLLGITCKGVIKMVEKERRMPPNISERMLEENRQAGYNHGYTVGYNEAVDDVVNLFKSKTTMENNLIEEIAEHLKVGGNS